MTDAKRLVDVSISLVGLTVLSPIMGVVAISVRLSSPGPVLFRQERVGMGDHPFTIHKFRTMRMDDGTLVSTTDDPRITRVGVMLRRAKLDELPQLFDVLRGDMSLVGPRPEVPKYVEMWTAEERRIILSVRPGVTDPASVAFRNEARQLADAADPESHYCDVIMPQKCKMYVDYVLGRSFWGDIGVIFRTVKAVALE